jgi:hypothetical protein
VHDLNDPLTWLPDDSVDLVLCTLVYEYVDNRAACSASSGGCSGPPGRWS